jgi:hypothetical protein
MPDQAPEVQAREFADAFRLFLNWIHASDSEGHRNEVAALVTGFLGPDGVAHSVVSHNLPAFEHVNLQTAIDAWATRSGRAVDVHGILLPQHYRLALQQVVSAESVPNGLRLIAPTLVALPNGPETTLGCLKLALFLVTDARGRYVLMVQSANEQHPSLEIEVAGLPADEAQAVLAELDQHRCELNVYRGHMLNAAVNPMGGGIILTFAALPGLRRDDVVLPDAVLTRAERHALGVAAHRDALLAAGQHLKRGLLLYGPSGTGKTHTTRYLLGQAEAGGPERADGHRCAPGPRARRPPRLRPGRDPYAARRGRGPEGSPGRRPGRRRVRRPQAGGRVGLSPRDPPQRLDGRLTARGGTGGAWPRTRQRGRKSLWLTAYVHGVSTALLGYAWGGSESRPGPSAVSRAASAEGAGYGR